MTQLRCLLESLCAWQRFDKRAWHVRMDTTSVSVSTVSALESRPEKAHAATTDAVDGDLDTADAHVVAATAPNIVRLVAWLEGVRSPRHAPHVSLPLPPSR
jgi:hypothetical protein